MKRSSDSDDSMAKRLKAYENSLESNRLYMRRKRNSGSCTINKITKGEQVKNWSFFYNLAFDYNPQMSFNNISLLQCGEMNIHCRYCGAVKFKKEPPGICCANGKFKLESFRNPPDYLRKLLDGNDEYSKHFMTNIRSYNNAFSFTSFGSSVINLFS